MQKHVPLRTNLSIAFHHIKKMTLYDEVNTLFSKYAINSSKFVGRINIYCDSNLLPNKSQIAIFSLRATTINSFLEEVSFPVARYAIENLHKR